MSIVADLEYVPGFVGQGARSFTTSHQSKAPLNAGKLPNLASSKIVPLVTCSTEMRLEMTKDINVGLAINLSKHSYRLLR